LAEEEGQKKRDRRRGRNEEGQKMRDRRRGTKE